MEKRYDKILTKKFLQHEYTTLKKGTGKISKEAGCSKQTVLYHLKKNNILLRCSNKTGKDITNKTKFELTALQPTGDINIKGELYWEFRCSCGNQHVMIQSKFGRVKSCGCSKTKKGKDHPYWGGCGDISLTFWNKITHSAGKRGLKFEITIEYIWKLFQKQKGKCKLSGIDLVIKDRNGTASLDRIDSTKGYIKGNVQWVYKKVNFMKQNLPEKEFIELCNKIVEQKGNK